MDSQRFNEFREKHGGYGSWAIWTPPSEGKPKSNIGDISLLDADQNPGVLEQVHANYIAVGLNISGVLANGAFCNFHSTSGRNRDFITRHAFADTPAWGCYMTDILKDFREKDSSKVVRHFRRNPQMVERETDKFLIELRDLEASFDGDFSPTILCFGGAVHEIMRLVQPRIRCKEIIQLRHYADYRKNKENYREEFLQRMGWY